MSVMSLRIAKIIACIRQAAPYLAIELILPGGSIIALILWLLRNRAGRPEHSTASGSNLPFAVDDSLGV